MEIDDMWYDDEDSAQFAARPEPREDHPMSIPLPALPEPAFGFLVVSEETGQWVGSRKGEAAFDADNLHAHAAAVSAAKDAEIAGLREELDAGRKSGSASDRLHNICAAIEAEADSSVFSREEWDRMDKENTELRAELGSLISKFHHAMKDAGWHPGRTDDNLFDIIREKGKEAVALRADNTRLQNEVVMPLRERVRVLEDALTETEGALRVAEQEFADMPTWSNVGHAAKKVAHALAVIAALGDKAAPVTLPNKGFTVNEHKQLAVKALEQMRGDDLYRARAAFRNCTPEQMAQKYGQSDQTRAEILAGYEAHDAKVTAALAWVMGQKCPCVCLTSELSRAAKRRRIERLVRWRTRTLTWD